MLCIGPYLNIWSGVAMLITCMHSFYFCIETRTVLENGFRVFKRTCTVFGKKIYPFHNVNYCLYFARADLHTTFSIHMHISYLNEASANTNLKRVQSIKYNIHVYSEIGIIPMKNTRKSRIKFKWGPAPFWGIVQRLHKILHFRNLFELGILRVGRTRGVDYIIERHWPGATASFVYVRRERRRWDVRNGVDVPEAKHHRLCS